MSKMILALLALLLLAACAPYPGPGGYAGWNRGGYWGSPAAGMNMGYGHSYMGCW